MAPDAGSSKQTFWQYLNSFDGKKVLDFVSSWSGIVSGVLTIFNFATGQPSDTDRILTSLADMERRLSDQLWTIGNLIREQLRELEAVINRYDQATALAHTDLALNRSVTTSGARTHRICVRR